MLNEVFINGTAAVETRKEGRSRVWELENGEVVENKNIDEYGFCLRHGEYVIAAYEITTLRRKILLPVL